MELHKIFSEELEEATRMGELEKSTAKSLQHDYFACQVSKQDFIIFFFFSGNPYFSCKHLNYIMGHVLLCSVQDHLEEVLDVVLANQRYVLAERHAQRKFLVHSLHSLNSLISDTFSSTSSNLDSWFTHIKRLVPIVVTNRGIK